MHVLRTRALGGWDHGRDQPPSTTPSRSGPPSPASAPGRPLLVLLHGYGADESDLFGLVPYLPPEYVVAAVRAPLAPPWPAPGYSWYAIEGIDGRDPATVTLAARQLIAWLGEAGRGAASIGLLGFSQGASVALQALRLEPERFGFVGEPQRVRRAGPAARRRGARREPPAGVLGTRDARRRHPGVPHRAHHRVAAGALHAERARLPRPHAQRLGRASSPTCACSSRSASRMPRLRPRPGAGRRSQATGGAGPRHPASCRACPPGVPCDPRGRGHGAVSTPARGASAARANTTK